MAFLLTTLKDHYIALRGYHTNRHLIVIESDDWGSIRMPSYSTFRQLQSVGDTPEKDAFLANDCLEDIQDLENLYHVLQSVKGKDGKPAVITANFAVANPDFERIKVMTGEYCYENIRDTYKRYYPHEDVFSCVQEGIKRELFFPQLHCREHLNVTRWMNDLKRGKKDTKIAFAHKTIGIYSSFGKDNLFGYMDAFNTVCSKDEELAHILDDSYQMFKQLFGFASKTFVASCFVWNYALEKKLAQLGIKGIQSAPWQYIPGGTDGQYCLKRHLHFTGERNKYGQFYTVRNCSYEPAYLQNPKTCVQQCMNEINASFFYKKPAIITSHRFNYISKINKNNAKANLRGLKELLRLVIEKYPDTEFITSAEMLEIMEKDR